MGLEGGFLLLQERTDTPAKTGNNAQEDNLKLTPIYLSITIYLSTRRIPRLCSRIYLAIPHTQ